MLPWDAAGLRRAAAAALQRLVALLLALLAHLTAASQPPPAPLVAAVEEADPREAAFAASAAGADYGYGGRLRRLRATEFSRLAGTAYLDHAGAALYSEAQVADAARALAGTVFGNPRASPRHAQRAARSTAGMRSPQRRYSASRARGVGCGKARSARRLTARVTLRRQRCGRERRL